jgi:hypothetical protein
MSAASNSRPPPSCSQRRMKPSATKRATWRTAALPRRPMSGLVKVGLGTSSSQALRRRPGGPAGCHAGSRRATAPPPRQARAPRRARAPCARARGPVAAARPAVGRAPAREGRTCPRTQRRRRTTRAAGPCAPPRAPRSGRAGAAAAGPKARGTPTRAAGRRRRAAARRPAPRRRPCAWPRRRAPVAHPSRAARPTPLARRGAGARTAQAGAGRTRPARSSCQSRASSRRSCTGGGALAPGGGGTASAAKAVCRPASLPASALRAAGRRGCYAMRPGGAAARAHGGRAPALRPQGRHGEAVQGGAGGGGRVQQQGKQVAQRGAPLLAGPRQQAQRARQQQAQGEPAQPRGRRRPCRARAVGGAGCRRSMLRAHSARAHRRPRRHPGRRGRRVRRRRGRRRPHGRPRAAPARACPQMRRACSPARAVCERCAGARPRRWQASGHAPAGRARRPRAPAPRAAPRRRLRRSRAARPRTGAAAARTRPRRPRPPAAAPAPPRAAHRGRASARRGSGPGPRRGAGRRAHLLPPPARQPLRAEQRHEHARGELLRAARAWRGAARVRHGCRVGARARRGRRTTAARRALARIQRRRRADQRQLCTVALAPARHCRRRTHAARVTHLAVYMRELLPTCRKCCARLGEAGAAADAQALSGVHLGQAQRAPNERLRLCPVGAGPQRGRKLAERVRQARVAPGAALAAHGHAGSHARWSSGHSRVLCKVTCPSAMYPGLQAHIGQPAHQPA